MVAGKIHYNQDELWGQHFAGINLSRLKFLDDDFRSVIQERINEAEVCFSAGVPLACRGGAGDEHGAEVRFSAGAPLAVIVLCGSALEGILHKCMRQYPEIFKCSSVAPKNQKRRSSEIVKMGNGICY